MGRDAQNCPVEQHSNPIQGLEAKLLVEIAILTTNLDAPVKEVRVAVVVVDARLEIVIAS